MVIQHSAEIHVCFVSTITRNNKFIFINLKILQYEGLQNDYLLFGFSSIFDLIKIYKIYNNLKEGLITNLKHDFLNLQYGI